MAKHPLGGGHRRTGSCGASRAWASCAATA